MRIETRGLTRAVVVPFSSKAKLVDGRYGLWVSGQVWLSLMKSGFVEAFSAN